MSQHLAASLVAFMRLQQQVAACLAHPLTIDANQCRLQHHALTEAHLALLHDWYQSQLIDALDRHVALTLQTTVTDTDTTAITLPRCLLHCSVIAQSLYQLSLAVSELTNNLYTVTHFYSLLHSSINRSLSQSQSLALFNHAVIDLFQSHLNSFTNDSDRASDDRRDVYRALYAMRMLGSPNDSALSASVDSLLFERVFYPCIDRWIDEVWQDDTSDNQSVLKSILSKIQSLYQFLASIHTDSDGDNRNGNDSQQRLLSYCYTRFTRHAIAQLFNLIVDYPDSIPRLMDLHRALKHSKLHSELIESLSLSFTNRLCHPGASTNDILATYVNAIRALKFIDHDGILTQRVCESVRQYVRQRSDCVKWITKMIVGSTSHTDTDIDANNASDNDSGNDLVDLSDELEDEPERDIGDDSDHDAEDFIDTTVAFIAANTAIKTVPHPYSALPPSWAGEESSVLAVLNASDRSEKWRPDPLTAHPTSVSRKGRHDDLLSLLFTLTPLTDANAQSQAQSPYHPFIEEYRKLLAHRLLRASGYSRDDEITRNERMKSRLGESELQACEIMVNDIEQSKRTHARLMNDSHHSDRTIEALNKELTIYILSSEYWPNIDATTHTDTNSDGDSDMNAGKASEINNDGGYQLMPFVQQFHAYYGDLYHTVKSPRKLVFLPELERVSVTVQLNDRAIVLTVNSLQLSALALLEAQATMSLRAMCQSLNINNVKHAIADPVYGEDNSMAEAVSRLRSLMTVFVSKGIVRESVIDGESHYAVIENVDDEQLYEEYEDDSMSADTHTTSQAQSATLTDTTLLLNYILSVLETFSSLSVDKLHFYLQKFALGRSINYNLTEIALIDQLNVLEVKGRVKQHEGLYSVR